MATKRTRESKTRRRGGDRSSAYFSTPEWQAKEREADRAIARGDVVGPFTTAKDMITSLHRAVRRTSRGK